MRNSRGVLNIYWKALWMPLLFIVLPLATGIVLTYFGSSEREWGLLALGVFMLLGGGFWAWASSEEVWHVWTDTFSRQTTMRGSISRKWVTEHSSHGGTLKEYQIGVDHHSFEVSKKIYNWLSHGDTVVIHYWPRSETVAKVEKLKE